MGVLANVGQGVAQEAAVYLEGVDKALSIGEGVVGAAIAADEETRSLLGETASERSGEAYTQLAVSLAQIIGRSSVMLNSIFERGLVEEDQLQGLLPPEGFKLTVGESISDDTPLAPIGEAASVQEQQQGVVVSTESTPADPELSEIRARQETMLEEIFGEGEADVIQSLSGKEMEQIGLVIKELYGRVPIGVRGKAMQPIRAQQFAEYISGTDLEEMATEYGITANGIQANLRKAVEILHREHSKEALATILDKAVTQLRANG